METHESKVCGQTITLCFVVSVFINVKIRVVNSKKKKKNSKLDSNSRIIFQKIQKSFFFPSNLNSYAIL